MCALYHTFYVWPDDKKSTTVMPITSKYIFVGRGMCNVKWVCLCIKHQTSGQAAERIITLSRFYIIYWQWQTLSRTKFSFGNSLVPAVSQSVTCIRTVNIYGRFFIFFFCLSFIFLDIFVHTFVIYWILLK